MRLCSSRRVCSHARMCPVSIRLRLEPQSARRGNTHRAPDSERSTMLRADVHTSLQIARAASVCVLSFKADHSSCSKNLNGLTLQAAKGKTFRNTEAIPIHVAYTSYWHIWQDSAAFTGLLLQAQLPAFEGGNECPGLIISRSKRLMQT